MIILLSFKKRWSIVNIPVAHHDGNYYIDENGLKELEENGSNSFKILW